MERFSAVCRGKKEAVCIHRQWPRSCILWVPHQWRPSPSVTSPQPPPRQRCSGLGAAGLNGPLPASSGSIIRWTNVQGAVVYKSCSDCSHCSMAGWSAQSMSWYVQVAQPFWWAATEVQLTGLSINARVRGFSSGRSKRIHVMYRLFAGNQYRLMPAAGAAKSTYRGVSREFRAWVAFIADLAWAFLTVPCPVTVRRHQVNVISELLRNQYLAARPV